MVHLFRPLQFAALLILALPAMTWACVGEDDSVGEQQVLLLYEKGQPVSDPSSYMMKIETAAFGWDSCGPYPAKCAKPREAKELVLCHMPGAQAMFPIGEWITLTKSPADACKKSEWTENTGDNNEKKWHCQQELYAKYMEDALKRCTHMVIPIAAADKCLRVDVIAKTARPCSEEEVDDLHPAALDLIVDIGGIRGVKDKTLVYGGTSCFEGTVAKVKINAKHARGQNFALAPKAGDKISVLMPCRPDEIPPVPCGGPEPVCSEMRKARQIRVRNSSVEFPRQLEGGKCDGADVGLDVLK